MYKVSIPKNYNTKGSQKILQKSSLQFVFHQCVVSYALLLKKCPPSMSRKNLSDSCFIFIGLFPDRKIQLDYLDITYKYPLKTLKIKHQYTSSIPSPLTKTLQMNSQDPPSAPEAKPTYTLRQDTTTESLNQASINQNQPKSSKNALLNDDGTRTQQIGTQINLSIYKAYRRWLYFCLVFQMILFSLFLFVFVREPWIQKPIGLIIYSPMFLWPCVQTIIEILAIRRKNARLAKTSLAIIIVNSIILTLLVISCIYTIYTEVYYSKPSYGRNWAIALSKLLLIPFGGSLIVQVLINLPGAYKVHKTLQEASSFQVKYD